jgi:hypothetical protein
MGGSYYPWKVLSVLAARAYLRGLLRRAVAFVRYVRIGGERRSGRMPAGVSLALFRPWIRR